MRKVLFLNFILLIFIQILNSCQKNLEKFETASPLKGEMKIKINLWLDKQKVESQPNKMANIELLKNSLSFDNLKIDKSNNGEKIVVIPIEDKFKTNKDVDKNSSVSLVVILDSSEHVRKGNLVIYVPDQSEINNSLPENTFYNIYNTARVKSKGLFKFLSVSGKLLFQLKYKNENLYSFGLIQSKENKKGKSDMILRENATCIDWFLVTTYYYSDGTTSQTSEYVGRTCTGCDDPTIQSLCPEWGNGGGGEDIALNPKLVDWKVVEQVEGLWYVKSTEKLYGAGQPARFTGITHESDMIIAAVGWIWLRAGVAVSFTSASAHSTISGRVTTPYGVDLDVSPITMDFPPNIFN